MAAERLGSLVRKLKPLRKGLAPLHHNFQRQPRFHMMDMALVTMGQFPFRMSIPISRP